MALKTTVSRRVRYSQDGYDWAVKDGRTALVSGWAREEERARKMAERCRAKLASERKGDRYGGWGHVAMPGSLKHRRSKL